MVPLLLVLISGIAFSSVNRHQQPQPRLSITEYIVSDTAKYESFRLNVINDGDSIVVIERAQPSCGCILVTVQRSLCMQGHPGDIYIAVTNEKVSTDQPITVDVYTNLNRETPLRLYVRKIQRQTQPERRDSVPSATPVEQKRKPGTVKKQRRRHANIVPISRTSPGPSRRNGRTT